MRLDEKFNKRAAGQVEVAGPVVHHGPQYDLGVRVTYYSDHASDKGQLAMHMTAFEALALAAQLIDAASRDLKYRQDRKEATQ